MSDAFRQSIEEIKLKCPIEEVVRERVPTLKQAGSLWVACCPFHEEKTPSFKVDPRRGTWHCYGACSTGGDQISFVERSYNVEFKEALDILAARCGVVLPRKGPRRDEGRLAPVYDALRRAEELYKRQLHGPRGTGALEYLRGRGLSDATLDAFGVGLAVSGSDSLVARAARRDVSIDVLVAAGLARRSDDGRPYDFFRDRVTFPVRDIKGRTVGFGARRLTDDDPRVPKYVNTSETDLFRKGQLIYGLDRALQHARRAGRLALVEGYTDVMAAHQVGHNTVVAVLGTSTTDEHAALVRRAGARRVDLVFDGDEAGRRATLRALHGLLPIDVDVRIVRLPGGADPCDYLIEHGAEPFAEVLDGAAPWFDFLVDEIRALPTGERWKTIDQLLALITRLPRPLQRDERVELLAERLGVPTAGMREQYDSLPERRREQAQRRRAEAQRREQAERGVEGEGGFDEAEANAPVEPTEALAYGDLVGAALINAELGPRVERFAEACPDDGVRRILEAIVDVLARGEALDVDHLLAELGEDGARHRVVPLVERASLAEDVNELFEDAVGYLERRAEQLRIQERIAEVRESDNEQAGLVELHRQLRSRVI